ncbi:cytochrome C [Dolichospermum sp. LEGE 00240]|uniref:cytochrome C n=1 Tax=Dolichospermum sp. LEGE 00240 TaxID=1828603 RepID=UPI0018802D9A|nr:cytochrome C [Dolichospermum sp. LEGE 00240]MBE9248736.1 cytochrome C [Dolichospermum sp. LEGE 00240]
MPNLAKSKSHRRLKRQLLIVMLVIFAWSVAMGWILGFTTSTHGANPVDSIGTVDVISAQYQPGQELYLENCASCHIALPPAVFPSQTWKNLLQDSQHYGVQINPLDKFSHLLVSKYLYTFSRVKLPEEATPYRLKDSRYFKALHPGVKLPKPVTMSSCVSCHIGADKYNFRSLSAEWE